jgi:hypothetical protein
MHSQNSRQHCLHLFDWRHGEGRALLVLANFYGEPESLPAPDGVGDCFTRGVLISSETNGPLVGDEQIQLSPFEAVAFPLKAEPEPGV